MLRKFGSKQKTRTGCSAWPDEFELNLEWRGVRNDAACDCPCIYSGHHCCSEDLTVGSSCLNVNMMRDSLRMQWQPVR